MPRKVAVAGGGIAACAACLTLAEAGLPVSWIAPAADGADRPGESLAAAAAPLLAQLGLNALLEDPSHRRAAASFTSWGSDALLERSAAALPGGMGHVIHRGRFEAAMTEIVGRRPGIAHVAGEVATVRRDAGGWRLATDGGVQLEAAFLVDATGRAAAIGRRLGTLLRGDSLVSAYAFLQQVDPEVEPTPATLVEAVEDGWWYATLLADNRLALNYYSDPDLMPHGLGRDLQAWRALAGRSLYVSRWIDSAGFALSQPPRLASAGSAWLDRAAGPDWIAVGDAAAAFDPLSAHGMTTALWTGIEAGRAVLRALDGAPEALDRYAERVLQGIARFRADRARVYGSEGRFAAQPFWRRRQDAGGRQASAGSAAPQRHDPQSPVPNPARMS